MRAARLIAVLIAGMAAQAVSPYQSEIEAWKKRREESLRSNWLQVSGLFWLHEGANRMGTDPSSDIVLPDGPAHAGVVELRNGAVMIDTRPVRADSDESVKVGRLSLFVIKRGDKIGIRMKDPDSEYLRKFHGLEYFPLNEKYRVTARFVDEPHKVPILNVLGQTEQSDCPGYAIFQLGGKEYRLYPIIEEPGDEQLFYIFRDLTSGKETYPAGRFLYSDLPKNGNVVLDFNKAYNPPCAFTDYATCPLPPKENHLAVRIEAGEKRYGH
jgi:uncharacterized protein (DUF1684 family)